MKEKNDLLSEWVKKSDSKSARAMAEIVNTAETAYGNFKTLSSYLKSINENHELDSYIRDVESVLFAYEKLGMRQLITSEDSLDTAVEKLAGLVNSRGFERFINHLEKAAFAQTDYNDKVESAVEAFNAKKENRDNRIRQAAVDNVAIVPMQHLTRYPILIGALQNEVRKTNPSEKTEALIQVSLDKVESFAVHFDKAKERNDSLTSFDKGLAELKQQATRLAKNDSVAGQEAIKLHAALCALRDEYANGTIPFEAFKQASENKIDSAQKTELGKHGNILDLLSRLLQMVTGKTIQPKPVTITNEMKASLQELKDSAKPEPAADIENSDTESLSGP